MLRNFALWTIVAAVGLTTLNGGTPDPGRIKAQKVVSELKAAHPEITSLELAATRSRQEGCKTIAATEANEIGQKCDKDELTAIKTDSPFVEQENDEFDVTLPIHDSAGKIMATAGMDFKAAGQTRETVTHQAKLIAAELEKRLTSKNQLFELAQ